MRRCIYCGWKIRDYSIKCDNCDMLHDEKNNRLYPGPDAPFIKEKFDEEELYGKPKKPY